MDRRDALVVGGTAIATAMVVLVIFWAGQILAGDPVAVPKPEIAWPVLKAGNCEITLRADKTSYKASEMPVVELEAVNTTESPIEVQVSLQMMSRNQQDRMSRMPVMATEAWDHSETLALQSGETKTFTIRTETKVQDGQMVSFVLHADRKTVMTRELSAPAAEEGKMAGGNRVNVRTINAAPAAEESQTATTAAPPK